ncbi:MAG TPA: ABC transporter substrate-binding protein, partial [Candidatus Acidoferrum sp.]|nr:ABC transporter substrate-binding protein [Candidatus Acidoferrum sp.]
MPRQNKFQARGIRRLALAVLVLTVLLPAGCNHSSAEPPGTVTFLVETMPANLDPRLGTDARSQQLDGLIFSSLLEHDSAMNLRGDVAERWDALDTRTYVFHLRGGVKFHDGRSLTSADVKFTFDSIMSGIRGSTSVLQSPKRGAFRAVQSIEAPDALTVIFHLSEPNAAFPWSLVRPAVGIVPNGSGPELAQHPIGSGPLHFVSARQDEEVVLERNPTYFRDPATIQRARFRVVPDSVVRALELRKGTADIELNSLTPDMIPVLAAQKDLAVTEEPGTIFSYISFNCEDEILRNPDVRRALAYATDRAMLARTLMRGQARVADGPLPPNNWAYEP